MGRGLKGSHEQILQWEHPRIRGTEDTAQIFTDLFECGNSMEKSIHPQQQTRKCAQITPTHNTLMLPFWEGHLWIRWIEDWTLPSAYNKRHHHSYRQ